MRKYTNKVTVLSAQVKGYTQFTTSMDSVIGTIISRKLTLTTHQKASMVNIGIIVLPAPLSTAENA